MVAVLTRPAKIGNVLKKELWADAGWCRKTITVTVATGMGIGAVLDASGVWIEALGVANAAVVLIDETVYDKAIGDHPLVVLYGGPSIVAKEALTYGDAVTSVNKDTAEAALLVLGIKAASSVL